MVDPLTRLRAEAEFVYASPVAPSAGAGPGRLDLMKTPVAAHALPQGGEGC